MLLSMVVVFILIMANRFGIEHFMLRFATVPDLLFSYLNGFGHYETAFHWYILYWAAFAGILAVLTVGMWQSSLYSSFLQRLVRMGKYVRKNVVITIVFLVVFIVSGGFIYKQTNIIGKYRNSKASLNWKISYERKYRKYAQMEQPVIKAVKVKVDLFPDEGSYTVKGSYLLKNETDQPIDRLLVGLANEVNSFQLYVQDAALQQQDEEFNQQWVKLKKPLAAGQEISMQFSFEVIRSGFTPFNNENSVVKNGSYIELEKYVPQFGYNYGLEIEDLKERKKMGLGALSTAQLQLKKNKIALDMTVSTVPDQYAVTVGRLQKSWIKDDRRYFSYKTEAPINFMFALSSARYEVKEEMYKNVHLRIFYQQGHGINTASMLRAMKASLDYCNTNFGAYEQKDLTLAEIPQYRGAATAYPGVIFSAERINFLGDFSNPERPDFGYAIVAHEVAHQWWANKLVPSMEPGKAMLTESLAKYTEMMVVEKAFGKMKLRQYLKDDNQLYFAMRNTDGTEMPLSKADDQPFVYYQKGGLIMYATKETIGEANVSAALRNLLKNPERTRPEALADALKRQAPVDKLPFIEESFNTITNYDLRLKVLACKPMANGKYNLQLEVEVNRQTQGKQHIHQQDIVLDVAVFNQDEAKWEENTLPVYLKKHNFSGNKTIINIVLDRKPAVAMIDPFYYMPDADLDDNLAVIK